VTCGCVGVPHLLSGGGDNANIFLSLVKASEVELDLITCDVMRAAIAYKWQAFGYRQWVNQLITFAIFFGAYLFSLFLLLSRPKAVSIGDFIEADDAAHLHLGALFFCVASFINFKYAMQELHELTNSGAREYLSSPQNWFDLLAISNVILLAILIAAGSEQARLFGAFGTVLLLPKVSAVARGHEKMSALSTMVQEVISDMVPFLSLMAFVILVNSFSFELLSPFDSEEYGTFSKAWMSAYALTLGEFEVHTYADSLLVKFFFHYFTVIVNIVLLNVLIAIISDTYERVEEKGKARGLLQRARILLEMQDSMSDEQLADETLFPAWLHVISRVEDVGSPDIWSGRLHAIKEHITIMEKKLAESEQRILDNTKAQAEAHHDRQLEIANRIMSAVTLLAKEQDDIKKMVASLEPPTATNVTLLTAPSPRPLPPPGGT